MSADCFNITCKGERHKVEGGLCQDYSLSVKADGLVLAVVCDGHGAAQYFRSETGAMFAAEAVAERVGIMVDEDFLVALRGKPFTAYGPMRGRDVSGIDDVAYLTICSLVLSIIRCWDGKVKRHVSAHPLTDKEAANIPEVLASAFRAGRVFNFAYGTTLLAYVQTKDFWFAFQIGDGKIVSLNKGVADFPVQGDEACHDHVTTSLCDNDALDEVRVSYAGDGQFPDAMLLCTDGLENAFLSDEKLATYYGTILNVLRIGGKEVLMKHLADTFPKISAITLGDDISLAGAFSKLAIEQNQ